jgi:hypothetical protein
MTLYYRTYSWGTTSPKITEEEVQFLNHLVNKKNWRIVQLPNGYFQTEHLNPNKDNDWVDVTRRETIEGAEAAIDASVEHYSKKLEFAKGPVVVKTFE